jgi:hypothetical protein
MSRFVRENWLRIAVMLTLVLIAAARLVVRSDSTGGAGGVYPIY